MPLNYWKCSYREKFFRTVFMTMSVVCVLGLLALLGRMDAHGALIAAGFFIAIGLIQGLYTYWRWQSEERSRDSS